MRRLGALLLVGLLGPFFSAAAERPQLIDTFRDWKAYTFSDAGGKICYIVSVPSKQEGDYTRRGDVFFLVTHRPSGQVFDEISVITGYTYKDGSTPKATVDGKGFNFFTRNDAAWPVGRSVEKSLLGAMKRGVTMVVTGTSTRGTLTTDTYSLRGVTAAMRKIDQECNRK
jgi:hypothetical protein